MAAGGIDQTAELLSHQQSYNSTENVTPQPLDQSKTMQYMLDCIQRKRNLDIYQFLAIYGGMFRPATYCASQKYNFTYSTSDRLQNVIKAIMCILVQVVGIALILYEFIKDNNRSYCDLNWKPLHIAYKLLALCLSAKVSYEGCNLFFVWKGIHKMRHYPDNEQFATFFAWIGFIINKLIALSVIIGGWFIIFFADNAFKIVLSSLALVKLMSLDDDLLHDGHYQQLKNKLLEDEACGYFNEKECELIDHERDNRFFIKCVYCIFVIVCFIASCFIGICY